MFYLCMRRDFSVTRGSEGCKGLLEWHVEEIMYVV